MTTDSRSLLVQALRESGMPSTARSLGRGAEPDVPFHVAVRAVEAARSMPPQNTSSSSPQPRRLTGRELGVGYVRWWRGLSLSDRQLYARDSEHHARAAFSAGAELSRPSEWRPIETIPHEKWVLAYFSGAVVEAMMQRQPGNRPSVLRAVESGRELKGATHWRPCPVPPPGAGRSAMTLYEDEE